MHGGGAALIMGNQLLSISDATLTRRRQSHCSRVHTPDASYYRYKGVGVLSYSMHTVTLTNFPRFAPPGGMTRALNMTYLRPLPLPATIRVQSEVIQNSRSTGLARGSILSKDGKKTYFTCEHHKIKAEGFNRVTSNVESKDSKL